MEEVSLKEKSWQMSGEVTSSLRPENSLLEEHVMFDHTTRLRKCIAETIRKHQRCQQYCLCYPLLNSEI